MDECKHITVSLATSALILIISRKATISITCLLSGVMVDLDHALDYYLNYRSKTIPGKTRQLRELPGFFLRVYLQREPRPRVYKILHSVEFLLLFPIFYFLGIWGEALTGILIGFMLHLVMDFIGFGHIGAVSLIYKIKMDFPCGSSIVKQRLSRIGRDIDRCQLCGVRCETALRIPHSWHIGFTRRGLGKIEVLCSKCCDRENKKDKSG